MVGIVFLTKITALCLSDHSLGACSKAVKARQAGWGGGGEIKWVDPWLLENQDISKESLIGHAQCDRLGNMAVQL